MPRGEPPPFFRSPSTAPSFLASLRSIVSDPAAVIPAPIYHDWAVKLAGPRFPLVITHPDDVRAVLVDKDGTFARDRQLRRLMRRAWGKGLAASEGEAWATQRRAASPAFRPAAIEVAKPLMATITRSVSQGWVRGQDVELAALMGRIVTEVVTTTLLSSQAAVDFDEVARDIPKVVDEVSTFGLLDAAPLSDALINRLRGLCHSAQQRRLRSAAAVIAHSRFERHHLPALLRASGAVQDNIIGFMLAGFETTALGAAWAIYLLARYPDWQEKVRAEAMGSGSTGDLPLTRRVVMEALRLYPPAPLLVRKVARPSELRSHRLVPGQAILIAVYAMHRHRQLWSNPDDFDPDRFISDDYGRGAFLPFGAGPRLCIAAQFASTEIATIITELIRAFRFSSSPIEPEVSLRISTHSLNGIHVMANAI
jgi:cytochrome P450